MKIWALPDSEDSEVWIDLTDGDSGETESLTWPLEIYLSAEAQTTKGTD